MVHLAGPYFLILTLLACCFSLAGKDTKDAEPAQKIPKPATPAQVEQAIQRGVKFLLKDQNKDGSWGSAHRTKDLNIYAPVPSAHEAFRTAVTAICIEALIETGAAEADLKAMKSLERGETWLLTNLPKVRRADGTAMYNVWTHAFGIQALVAMHQRKGVSESRQKEIRELIVQQIDRLRRYESVDGGWGYYDFRAHAARPTSDSISFVTATGLIAFYRAEGIGIETPAEMKKRAIEALNRQRKNDGSYLYGEYLKERPMRLVNRPGGSLGRSQACSLALRLWGDKTVTDEMLSDWLERLITRNGWLDIGRKRPIPHESWFQVAGYFYYYGHYYGMLCADQLEKAKGDAFKARLAGILIPLQEKDGTWWDFPLYNYHQQYGTAFALMALAHCK